MRTGFGPARRRGRLVTDDLGGLDDRGILHPVRQNAGKKLVEHHAHRVHVGPLVDEVGVSIEVLRRHVPDGAQHRALFKRSQAVRRVYGVAGGKAEVDHAGRAVPVDEQVGRLEVAMENARGVTRADGITERNEQADALVRREAVLVGIVRDGPGPAQVLHHEVARRPASKLRAPEVEDRDDVGVLELPERPRLALAPLGTIVAGAARDHDLDRHRPSEVRVEALVEQALAVLGDEPARLVPADDEGCRGHGQGLAIRCRPCGVGRSRHPRLIIHHLPPTSRR